MLRNLRFKIKKLVYIKKVLIKDSKQMAKQKISRKKKVESIQRNTGATNRVGQYRGVQRDHVPAIW